jgi:hypothetical protein
MVLRPSFEFRYGLKFVQHFGKQTEQNCFLDPGTSGSRDQCLDGDGLCILHAQQSAQYAKRVETIRKDGLIMCGPYSSEVSWCVTEVLYSPPQVCSSFFIILDVTCSVEKVTSVGYVRGRG